MKSHSPSPPTSPSDNSLKVPVLSDGTRSFFTPLGLDDLNDCISYHTDSLILDFILFSLLVQSSQHAPQVR